MPRNILEKNIQKSIKDYLELKKYTVVKFSSVGIYDRNSNSYIPQGRKGVSDLLCCQPKTGRFIAIEVKKPGNKPSEFQSDFINEIQSKGGLAFVAYSIDDVLAQGL